MRLSTYKIFIFSFFILLNYSLSQDECEDIGGFGGALTCEFILDGGVPCDGTFSGVPMTEICPVSCDACPDDDGSGITDGCDLPDNTLYITSDGSVLYNSSEAIGGFQFAVDGAAPTAASGGDAELAGFTISTGGSTVLAFSFTGATVPAGCGTLVDLTLDGDATGLSTIIFADAVGGELDFSYYEPPLIITDGCDLPDNTLYITSDGSVLYNSSEAIGGFQFAVDGAAPTAASGGDAELAGFTISTGGSTVLAFSFTGATVPAGCGTLVDLTLDGDATGLSTIIFADAVGGELDFSYYDGSEGSSDIAGCTDEEACNYDSNATIDDNSCEYASINFDCEGNCLIEEDCLGECGGNAEIDCNGVCDGGDEIDECGVCGGPGAIYECGCEELPSNDIVDGCDLPDNTLYITSDGSVLYNSTDAIGGFQFAVDGTTASAGSGGDAGSAGFTISTGGSTVLAFSFTGATVPAGCGTLVNLSLDGDATGLSTIIISDAVGVGLDFSNYEGGDGEVCDCDGNTIDECGVCGGPGAIYECGCEELPSNDIVDGCDLPDNTLYITSDGSVLYNSTDAIGGFQFAVDGTTASAGSGGDAGSAGFTISTGGSTVLAFSFTGATVPAGCGTLVNLSLDGDATGLSTIIISDAVGVGLDFSNYEGGDGEVCDCDGNTIDECGVCGGDGIADGACDCDGNVDLGCGCGEAAAEENFDCDGNCIVDTDCAGVCGGDAVEDECGVCGGPGIADGACDCDGNVDLGCGCEAAAEENFDCDGNCIVDTDCSRAYVVVML